LSFFLLNASAHTASRGLNSHILDKSTLTRLYRAFFFPHLPPSHKAAQVPFKASIYMEAVY